MKDLSNYRNSHCMLLHMSDELTGPTDSPGRHLGHHGS